MLRHSLCHIDDQGFLLISISFWYQNKTKIQAKNLYFWTGWYIFIIKVPKHCRICWIYRSNCKSSLNRNKLEKNWNSQNALEYNYKFYRLCPSKFCSYSCLQKPPRGSSWYKKWNSCSFVSQKIEMLTLDIYWRFYRWNFSARTIAKHKHTRGAAHASYCE